MRKMTAANVRSAYGGESMAHMRYAAWAEATKNVQGVLNSRAGGMICFMR